MCALLRMRTVPTLCAAEDLYDRLLQDPATTLATAVVGWRNLRYLCAAGTTEMSWVVALMQPMHHVPLPVVALV